MDRDADQPHTGTSGVGVFSQEGNDYVETIDAKSCLGCGAILQTSDPQAPGYIPHEATEKDTVICRRCFRIRHYNEVSPITIQEDKFREILAGILDKQAVVVHVVDLFDFPGSVITSLHRFIGNNPLIVVANKADILPKQTSMDRVKEWLRKELERLHLKPTDICLVSSKTRFGLESVKVALEKVAIGRDIYVVGVSNVGKSTCINALVKAFGNLQLELTTSRFPGTTLSTVEIPMPELQTNLIDTPGILTTHRISDIVCPDCLKTVTPNQTIRPKVYQLQSGQTLFLGGLARIDFVSGPNQSFVCYTANSLAIHRTKLQNADNLYHKHVAGLLSPPCDQCDSRLKELVTHSFTMPKRGERDIVISGIGWVAVKGSGAEIKVHVPKGIDVTLRPVLI
jgi:ribosome biogenesis GTPase YqeH